MYTDHHISPEEHARWFETLDSDQQRKYWIIESNSVPVGLVNLYDIDQRNKRCSWAFYLGAEEGPGQRKMEKIVPTETLTSMLEEPSSGSNVSKYLPLGYFSGIG